MARLIGHDVTLFSINCTNMLAVFCGHSVVLG